VVVSTRRGTVDEQASYTWGTESTVTTSLSPSIGACSQCERPLPAAPALIERWRHGSLFLAGELDGEAAALLLCPDCVEEEHTGAFDEGGQE
jgi:hypothetical protein